MAFAHTSFFCATLSGTLSSEPTLYLPITVSSIASLMVKPSRLLGKSVTTSMVISHICPTFSSRVIFLSNFWMFASISGSGVMAGGVCPVAVRHTPAHKAAAAAILLSLFFIVIKYVFIMNNGIFYGMQYYEK